MNTLLFTIPSQFMTLWIYHWFKMVLLSIHSILIEVIESQNMLIILQLFIHFSCNLISLLQSLTILYILDYFHYLIIIYTIINLIIYILIIPYFMSECLILLLIFINLTFYHLFLHLFIISLSSFTTYSIINLIFSIHLLLIINSIL